MPLQNVLTKVATCIIGWDCFSGLSHPYRDSNGGAYGTLPQPGDPFQFIPCTEASWPPALDDSQPKRSWAAVYDANATNWSWGAASARKQQADDIDMYDGRGIYLCGYLDLPMDYTNSSDERITRIAVTKYQVSGLARLDGRSRQSTGRKSERTLLVNPGGPGSSGTGMVWSSGEHLSAAFTDGTFDVLGWDPRGVNMSLPSLSCYPHDAIRDRWALRSGYLFSGQYREASPSPMEQLRFADAVNAAVFNACREKFGDFPRFVSTAFVARDVDALRAALGERELTSYMVSYGTVLSATYASMFPHNVGRMVLDGNANPRNLRHVDGLPRSGLDNVTDTWRDGFLGECISAGPEHCDLAEPVDGTDGAVTRDQLQARMEKLLRSLINQPLPAYDAQGGPSLITYSQLVFRVTFGLLWPETWPTVASALYALEQGDPGPAAALINGAAWKFQPDRPAAHRRPSSEEARPLVLCGDAHYDPEPEDDLAWWDQKWQGLVDESWLAGNELFNDVLACRQARKLWEPAEVYAGDFNHTLENAVLLVSSACDPATQLRDGRELLREMGEDNARLVVHDSYGHSSQALRSSCTDGTIRAYLLKGEVPESPETRCKADRKPYLSHAEMWKPGVG